LCFFLFLPSGYVICQDLIYKNDSTVLRVNIIEFNGKTIIYHNPGDTAGFKYYLSKFSVDSLKYVNGRSLDFTYTRNQADKSKEEIPRNYIAIDIFNLLFSNTFISYERIITGGRNSFVAGLMINPNSAENYWYADRSPMQFVNYDPYSFFVKVGFNHYPFNYSLSNTKSVRLSTGLSLNMGSYRKVNWDYYYQNGMEIAVDHVSAFCLMGSINSMFYMGNSFQFIAGIDVSMIPLLTFFCPKFGLSIGF